ncbi:BTAD domain-containing putative transcriptional regulator [Amycolatopsis sp. NPDC026612]|uniref:ATP-binding protein n=1 Tax=Amycolatopsis sp. NPDC026612 TaxID=3155466 RepID=UPI0033F85E51
MAEVSILLLGDVQVHAAGARVPLSGARQQKLLAALALAEGRLVTVSSLVDTVWDAAPPHTAVRQVRNLVTALRRTLVAAGAPESVIVAEGAGFRMDLTGLRCDVVEFDALAKAGDRRAALRLWRGPALAGLDGEILRGAADALVERRLSLLERHFATVLDEGGSPCPQELAEAVADHPLRESLVVLAMTALYRAGRQSDAIDAYTALRTRLRDELGVEPACSARELYERILRQDPGLTGPAAPVRAVPRQLPGLTTELAGRDGLLAEIRAALHRPTGTVAPIGLLVGPAGIGKTSLALAAGAALAGDFPDGQLFADLRGAGGAAVDAHTVLGRLLAALGVAGPEIPDDPEERVARYRTALAGRRMLVVLDDAAAERQVRPLLPGTPSCATLITSRRRLGALLGASRWTVPVLEPDAGLAVLTGIAGAPRAAAEPDAATELVELCGGLPLAVCIAAGRVAVGPDLTIAELATELAQQRRRLDGLSIGDLDVRATIELSYRALDAASRRLFRYLSLVPMSEWPAWVGAELLDDPAGPLLGHLVDLHLVDLAARDALGRRRYRMHGLVAAFARERALAEETPQARAVVVERHLSAWLDRAKKADGQLADATADARDWFDIELPNLLTAVDEACGLPGSAVAGELALSLGAYLNLRAFTADEGRRLLAVVEHVRRTGPDETLLRLLSVLFPWVSRTARARQMLALAAEQEQLARRLGDRSAEERALVNGVWGLLRAGRLTDAAHRIAELGPRLVPTSPTTVSLDVATASMHLEAGRPGDALPCIDRAAEGADLLGDVRLGLRCEVERAVALMEAGRIAESETVVAQGLATARETRNDQMAAYLNHVHAELDALRGGWGVAAEAMDGVVRTYEDNADWLGLGLALGLVADLARARDQPTAGVAPLTRALAIWRRLDAPLEIARTHARAERVFAALGDRESAGRHERQWRSAFDGLGLGDSSLRILVP